jgi:RHS repeat-associated protein
MLTRVNNGVTKSPAFNANGQQTDDGVNYISEWDAFGRLRKVKNRTTSALVVEYTYNGLNMQIGRHADLDADGDVDATDKWEWTIYDPRWRRVATFMVAGGSTFGGAADSDPKERYVHHAAGRSGGGSYLDSVILRDRDQTAGNNGVADGTLEQRLYYGQNWRADTVVLMSSTGRILERVTYSAYGVATRHPVADFNRDGFTDFFDDLAYDDCYTGSGGGCPSGQTADLNLDGFVDQFDYDEWDLSYAEQVNTARGVLSQSDASAAVNRLGYAGYFFEPATQTYLVRNREYDPNVGVWDERDPMGYHDGSDLYMYVKDDTINGYDPMGLDTARFCCRQVDGVPTLPRGGPTYHCWVECCPAAGQCVRYSLLNGLSDGTQRGRACIIANDPRDSAAACKQQGATLNQSGVCNCFASLHRNNRGCNFAYEADSCNSNWYASAMWRCCTGQTNAPQVPNANAPGINSCCDRDDVPWTCSNPGGTRPPGSDQPLRCRDKDNNDALAIVIHSRKEVEHCGIDSNRKN